MTGHPAKTLNITQAAAIAGVSRRTIYNWLTAGTLEHRKACGSVRIIETSLTAALSAKGLRRATEVRA